MLAEDYKFRHFDTLLNRYSYFTFKDIFRAVYQPKGDIEQFSTLQDNRGRDIFAGDIMRVRVYENRNLTDLPREEIEQIDLNLLKGKFREEYFTEVRFAEGEFVFSCSPNADCGLSCLFGDMRFSHPIFEFEVVGNVNENKELLDELVRID